MPHGLNLDEILAIDVHTHVSRPTSTDPAADEQVQSMARYFRTTDLPVSTVPELAAYYRERKLACVTFIVDNSAASGRSPRLTNEELARQAHENADVVIPFASVDPHAGRAAANQARRLIEEHGVRGFKFHPNTQEFYPNDRFAYPIYEVLEQFGVPALFHSGHTGAGAGVRGGAGIRLKYSNPMHVDDVAVDFPDLPIVLAHPSFPWQDEAISVALHKPTVHIDLSGWSPKYFPANLIQYANTLLRDKVMFGSDFPVLKPERWLADFERLEIKPEVRPLILKGNAARLLRLDDSGA